jgi:hypothetical protein
MRDLTHLRKADLAINWNQSVGNLETTLKAIIKGARIVNYSAARESVKEWSGQQMYDFKRDPTDKELNSGEDYGGLPIKDERRENKKTYGISNSKFIGFMDDNTPVRIRQDSLGRVSTESDRVWFRLDNDLKSCNKTRIHSGPTDKYGYCAYDLPTARKTFAWFAITKVLNGVYPIWANQFDIWSPNIPAEKEKEFYSLCFAFGLSENRCVVTKFEKDNPVADAPEVLVDNPLCPGNNESFWSTTLDNEIVANPSLAGELVALVTRLYKKWNENYCKGGFKYSVGLRDEAYFKYFDYKDFVTPYSGLIQIRKYAEIHNATDLLEDFENISAKTKEVREKIYHLLVDEFGYFE